VVEVVGLSHFDLDSLGGVLALQVGKPGTRKFWELAAHVDTHGPHRTHEFPGIDDQVHAQLLAWHAWSEKHRVLPPRDGSVADVTGKVNEARAVLERIFAGDADLLAEGRSLEARTEALNRASFVEEAGLVVVRVSDSFVNHLYRTPEGKVARAVVSFNTATGAITVSFAGEEAISARDFVQALWGDEAGVHKGIAGSPRGVRMSLVNVCRAADKLQEALQSGKLPRSTVGQLPFGW
jgi:hypothetical protein